MAPSLDMGEPEYDRLERAARCAVDLHRAVEELSDPALKDLVALILMELGKRVAALE